MTPDIELERIQEIALSHAIEEMDASNERTLDSRDDRQNRGFLTGMAGKSLGVAVRIEQFLILRRREGWSGEGGPSAEAAKSDMVKRARAEVQGILARVKAN